MKKKKIITDDFEETDNKNNVPKESISHLNESSSESFESQPTPSSRLTRRAQKIRASLEQLKEKKRKIEDELELDLSDTDLNPTQTNQASLSQENEEEESEEEEEEGFGEREFLPANPFIFERNPYNTDHGSKAQSKYEFNDFIVGDDEESSLSSSSPEIELDFSTTDSDSSEGEETQVDTQSRFRVNQSQATIQEEKELKKTAKRYEEKQKSINFYKNRDESKFIVLDDEVEKTKTTKKKVKRKSKSHQSADEDCPYAGVYHRAAFFDQVERFKKLSSLDLAKRVESIECERSVLMVAVENNSLQVLHFLKSQPQVNFHQLDPNGGTLLHIAAESSTNQTLEWILENTDLNPDIQDSEGRVSLHYAITSPQNQFEKVFSLIAKGATVNMFDRELSSPLVWAAAAGQVEIVQLFLDNQAQPTVQDSEGRTALHCAALEGHTDVIQVLSKRFPELTTIRDKEGWIPLMYADFNIQKESGNTFSLRTKQIYQQFGRAFFAKIFQKKIHFIALLSSNTGQLSILGEHVRSEKSAPIVRNIIRFIGEIPDFNSILNQFLQSNINLLRSNFSFLLTTKKRALLDFSTKKRWFHHKLQYSTDILEFEADRSDLVESATEVVRADRDCFHTIKIKFRNEPGFGLGVTREFFSLVSKDLVSSERGLFSQTENGNFEINSKNFDRIQKADYYLTGRFWACALVQRHLTNFRFTRPLFKALLDIPVTFDDLEQTDYDLWKKLKSMLEKDDEQLEDLFLTFQIFERGKGIELIPKGANIYVTTKNCQEYINAYARWKLVTSVSTQINWIKEGLLSILSLEDFQLFDAQEIELLTCGLPEIDLKDWRENTIYQGCSENDEIVDWFWKAVTHMKPQERALLLRFSTGSAQVPPEGFSHLKGLGNSTKFCLYILSTSSGSQLPSASTCFNTLKVPRYSSLEILESKLFVAIRYGNSGFAFS